MALIPGTLPNGTNFPGNPQGLLNLFAGYLSAAPYKRTFFLQANSGGIPTDGTALWWDTSLNVLKAYESNSWVIATVPDYSLTPVKLSTGGPAWDASGNVTLTGSLTATSAVVGASGSYSGDVSAATVHATTFYGDGSRLTGISIPAGMPPGTVISYASSTVPSGFLACDGTNNLSRTTYANLFAAISNSGTPIWAGTSGSTFGVPDLRGYFVRGAGTNGDATAAGTFGTKIADSFKSHKHTDTGHAHNNSVNGSGVTGLGKTPKSGSGGECVGDVFTGGISINNAAAAANISFEGGTETAPKHIPLLYCIKF